jgi:DNA polymerase-3 subunit gamma/tau
MAYQVIARKYRPQRFEDVVGQRGVTQTLQNAISTERLAQAFVFAGPRGVGKTTTARILARALNCESGPTSNPCGSCNACVEITEGRNIDVLEIDAATHTQIEHVREVIIAGLAMAPVRDRYKVFIIDECHQLSSHSFNALLKSIEEPPPHVVFIMATTELRKIPDTILSRSQVFEFRAIGTQSIIEQLLSIAETESIAIENDAISLIGRAADGSMRDAQSALDQVIAFAGDQITTKDVSTVLGLIGRDPVLEAVEVIANENQAAVFELAGRFVEAGYDLRLVCRELTRAMRDLIVISIDATRAQDPEIAGDADRDRLIEMSKRFSREDLMRAFDVLARAEFQIRSSSQPRYHFEIALLKLIHLRKLVPLSDLLEGHQPTEAPSKKSFEKSKSTNETTHSTVQKLEGRQPTKAPSKKSFEKSKSTNETTHSTVQKVESNRSSLKSESSVDRHAKSIEVITKNSNTRMALLAEIKKAKKFFYGTVVAQAQNIELVENRFIFTFTAAQRTLATQVQQSRGWLETMASRLLERTITVVTAQGNKDSTTPELALPKEPDVDPQKLRSQVMKDQVVQAMLEVFPAEIGKIENID